MYTHLLSILLTLSDTHLTHAAPGSCRLLKEDTAESKGWWGEAWSASSAKPGSDADPSTPSIGNGNGNGKQDWVVTPEWCVKQGIDANAPPKVKDGEVVNFDGHFWDGRSWWSNGGDEGGHGSSLSGGQDGYDGGKDTSGFDGGKDKSGYQGGKPSQSKSAYAAVSSAPAEPSGAYGLDGYPSSPYPADPTDPYTGDDHSDEDDKDNNDDSHGSWPRPSKAPWGNFSTSARPSSRASSSRTSSLELITTLSRTSSKISSSTLSSVSSTKSSSSASSSFTSSVGSSTLSSSVRSSSSMSSSASSSMSSSSSSSSSASSSMSSSLSSSSSASSSMSSSSSSSSSASSTLSTSSISSSMTSSASSSTITSSVVSSSTTSSAITSSSSVSACPPKATCPTTGRYAIQQVAPVVYATTADDFFLGGDVSRTISFSETTLTSASRFRFVFDSACRCRLTTDDIAGSFSSVVDSPADSFVDHVFRFFAPGAALAAGGIGKESIVTCSANMLGQSGTLSCTAIDSAGVAPDQSVLYSDGADGGTLRITDNADGGADGSPQGFIVVPVV